MDYKEGDVVETTEGVFRLQNNQWNPVETLDIPSGPMPTGKMIPTNFETQAGLLKGIPSANLSAVAEPALTIGTGMMAEPLAGIGGLAMLPFGSNKAVQIVKDIRSGLTYLPQTEQGQKGLDILGKAMTPISAPMEWAQKGLGELGYKIGGPVGGAIGETLPTAVLMSLSSPKVRSLFKRENVAPLIKDAAPTTEMLKDQARAIYNEIDDAGAVVNTNSIDKLRGDLISTASKSGFNKAIHPKTSAALNELENFQGPQKITNVDTIRQIFSEASKSIDPADARMASMMIDKIDDYFDGLKSSDFMKGQGANVGTKYKDARQLWSRAKKSELIMDAFEKSKNQASGFENGLRTQFRSIINNKRKLRGFTTEEIDAMRTVVRGGTAENIAKAIGKFGFTEGQASSMLLSSLGVAGGAAIGGPTGAVAVPVIGQVSKKLAQKLTRNNAEFADAVVRAGPKGTEVVRAYLKHVPKESRDVGELTQLLLRPEVSLKGLEAMATGEQKLIMDAIYYADLLRAQNEIQSSTDSR